MQTKVLMLVLFVLGTTMAATAQSSNAYNAFPTTTKDAGNSIYADVENDLYFIDFESLSVNLENIVVRDENGDVILEKKVFDLPVNTIYELDLSAYKEGKYKIELQSFTGTLRKEITLRK